MEAPAVLVVNPAGPSRVEEAGICRQVDTGSKASVGKWLVLG